MSLYSNRIIKLFSLSALFFVIRLLLCFRWRRLYALSAGEGVEGKGMIETYKIVSGKYDSLAAPMLPSPHSYVTRGHDLRLQKNRARYDLRKFFFY